MCIISGDPVYVAKTKIFVAPVVSEAKEPRQLTVYCNHVGLKKASGTMILPFPDSEVVLYNLETYAELFEHLKMIWPIALSKGTSRGLLSQSVARVQVGSYTASTVSLEELAHLNDEDKAFYVIDSSTIDFIRANYPKGYKFVLCRLDQQKEYHPFGFIHGSLPDGALFVPTMHYHQHAEVTDSRGANFSKKPKRPHDPDWDHVIYFWNARPKDISWVTDKTTSTKPPRDLQLDKLPALPELKCLTAIKVTYYSGNHDLAAELI